MNSIDYQQFPAPCCAIAREAGRIILQHSAQPIAVTYKPDNSPVTLADNEANAYITAELKKLTPSIPIIAEEDKDKPVDGHSLFWLVDPLDGTRAFVNGEKEYTVNIALVENGKPILGVIHAPALGSLYYGMPGHGAFSVDDAGVATRLSVRVPAKDGLVVLKSKSHPGPKIMDFLSNYLVKEIIPSSSSIKFCIVAEGNGDIYPRFGKTMEWDTAAGHAILKAAGGHVLTEDGKELTYGKEGYKNPYFYAYGAELKQSLKL